MCNLDKITKAVGLFHKDLPRLPSISPLDEKIEVTGLFFLIFRVKNFKILIVIDTLIIHYSIKATSQSFKNIFS